MCFIFPQNYSFKNKLFGFIDYTTVIFNLFLYLIIFLLVRCLPFTFIFKLSIFITFTFPFCLFSVFGFNNENIVYFLFYMIKFVKNRKVYFFSK